MCPNESLAEIRVPNDRIEAETRNVETLMKAGSLEEAASSACSLFDACQEAGLLVNTAPQILPQ